MASRGSNTVDDGLYSPRRPQKTSRDWTLPDKMGKDRNTSPKKPKVTRRASLGNLDGGKQVPRRGGTKTSLSETRMGGYDDEGPRVSSGQRKDRKRPSLDPRMPRYK